MARPGGRSRGRGERSDARPGPAGPVPELLRRALSVGLSGFFLTESALRRALGETLPRDWIDFLVDQSERTRSELLERVSFEVSQSLEKLDLAAIADELLTGRTLELRMQIRLREDDDAGGDADA